MSELLANIDGLFVTNPTNIRYLTGFVGVSPEEREAFVLVTSDQTYLFTNALYTQAARALPKIMVVEISRESPISAELVRLTAKENIKKLGFEDENLTVAELARLKQKLTNVTFVPTQNRVEQKRRTKEKDEITNITLAAKITDQAFAYILKRIRPGITENRLAYELEGFLKIKGGDLAFSPIVAFNQNSAMPHYSGRSNNPLRKHSLILLDFGAKVNGYCADMTRVVFLDTPNDTWVHGYEAVLRANQKALDSLKNGERNGATLDAASREVIAEAGLPVYPHSLGHGVGLAIHESPRLSVKNEEILANDMFVTVEPGVYIEGSYGVRIEDLVRLTDSGIDVLSKSPKEPIIL